MKVRIDEDLCAGTGACEQICPEVFEVLEGIAHVKTDTVADEFRKLCLEAAENCPTEAISIEQ